MVSRLAGLLLLVSCTTAFGDDVVELRTEQDFRSLCEGLSGKASQAPPGDPVSRGWAKALDRERREELLTQTYRVVLQAEEFRFDDYQPERSLLALHTAEGFGPFGGRARLLLAPKETAVLGIQVEDARSLVALHASSQVRLAVDFLLDPDGPGDPVCVVRKELTGRSVPAVAIIPQLYRWLGEKGEVLALVEGANPAEAPAAAPAPLGLQPRVQIGQATDLDTPAADDVEAEAEDRIQNDLEGVLEPLLLPCLTRRIETTRSAVEGSVVLQVRIGPGGRVEQTRIRQRLVSDPDLVRCVLDSMDKASIPRRDLDAGRKGRRRELSVPIFFQSVSLP